MNVNASKAVGSECIASSSISRNSTHLLNGGSCDGVYNHPSNDLLGAISSLRLQVVVAYVLLLLDRAIPYIELWLHFNLLYNFPSGKIAKRTKKKLFILPLSIFQSILWFLLDISPRNNSWKLDMTPHAPALIMGGNLCSRGGQEGGGMRIFSPKISGTGIRHSLPQPHSQKWFEIWNCFWFNKFVVYSLFQLDV